MIDIFVILILLCVGIYAAATLLERRLVALQASIDRVGEAASRLALARMAEAAAADGEPPTDPGRVPVQTDAG